ncbi:MAG: T9SS type A sorting domain-containing protein [Bacteroidetes bacterium]|nr:T9SS type A sorting domain-containing protein [Bacteroidota bacterium]
MKIRLLQSSLNFALVSLILFCLTSIDVQGQPVLKPFLGDSLLPSDADSICNIPQAGSNYDTQGYNVGDTVADFTLFKVNGTPVNLRTELQSGKPVLLVDGSFTCPAYRDRMPDFNTIYSTYANDLIMYVVYVVEAHPIVDVSPYSGTVWTVPANTSAGINYTQAKTYGERKTTIAAMNAYMTVDPEILIDGICNIWWSNFGPAPNNAYLIDVDGTVYAKHGWFNKAPNDMVASIDALLAMTSGIEDVAEQGDVIRVFPNPFTNQVTFNFIDNNVDYNLKIFDSFGRMIREFSSDYTGKVIMNREELTSGIYFYQYIDSNGNIITGKLIAN